MKMYLRSLTFLMFISVVFISNNTATAVSAGFRISPVKEEFLMERGESKTVHLTVSNVTNETVLASAEAYNGFARGDNGELGLDLDNKNQYSNDFRQLVSPIPDFQLNPAGQEGSQKVIDAIISIPTDALPGAYIGAISISPASSNNEVGQISLTGRVATIFLINVKGQVKQGFELKNLDIAKNNKKGALFINAKNDLSILTSVHNTGNTYIQPYGKLLVYKGKKVIEEIEFNNEKNLHLNVLPDQIRKFENKLKNSNYFGKYDVVANVSYLQTDGGTGDLITAKTSFWVFPGWLVVTVIGSIAIAIFGILYMVFGKKMKVNKPKHSRR